jgi:hypothetical protein
MESIRREQMFRGDIPFPKEKEVDLHLNPPEPKWEYIPPRPVKNLREQRKDKFPSVNIDHVRAALGKAENSRVSLSDIEFYCTFKNERIPYRREPIFQYNYQEDEFVDPRRPEAKCLAFNELRSNRFAILSKWWNPGDPEFSPRVELFDSYKDQEVEEIPSCTGFKRIRMRHNESEYLNPQQVGSLPHTDHHGNLFYEKCRLDKHRKEKKPPAWTPELIRQKVPQLDIFPKKLSSKEPWKPHQSCTGMVRDARFNTSRFQLYMIRYTEFLYLKALWRGSFVRPTANRLMMILNEYG